MARHAHLVVVIGILATGPLHAGGPRDPPPVIADDPIGTPFRVRDMTFPGHMILGFFPAPAAPLGRGRQAYEVRLSMANHFQVSPAAEDYLAASRGGGEPRKLDLDDALAILDLPPHESFYLDGEFHLWNVGLHWGLTPRVDLSLDLYYTSYSGGFLDSTVYGFHELFGIPQDGRQYVQDDQFQLVFGTVGEGTILLDPPSSGGLSDPSLSVRYAFPGDPGGWRFNLEGGVKVPIADEDELLSSGSFDFGLQFTADRRWRRDGLVINLAWVDVGRFSQFPEFRPAPTETLTISWLRRYRGRMTTQVQALAAQNTFADLVGSRLADPEFQITLGFKWATSSGTWSVGITENLFNFDNTPDIALPLGWGILLPCTN